MNILKNMTQTSLSQSPNDTTSSQDVIEIKTVTRSVGRKATITKEELFQAALNLIGPQKVLLHSAYVKLLEKLVLPQTVLSSL